ncbi:MAG: LamG domain-containing protein, partial [Armatimonadetes bacterium]|nr:LamG domain-containing protein [Armatimonadota bacterium]
EPFPEEGLEAPGGQSEPVSLRGTHIVLLLLQRGEMAEARISATEGAELFPQTIWAVFDPLGNMVDCGEVAVGKASVVRIRPSAAGIYRLLLNTGPASANSCRLAVRAHRWAIECLGYGAHEEDPLYYHTVRDFKLAGLNLDMLDFEGLRQEFVSDEGLSKWTDAVARWAEFSRRFQLRLMPAVDLGGTEWEIQAWEGCRPGLYVKHYEEYPLAPCPLDWRFWEQVYLRRGRAVAQLSRKNPWVVGYGLDPEMYKCWHYGHYMLSGTCFCDYCLGGFLRSKNMPTDVLAQLKTGAERHEWLNKQGLMSEYYRHLEEEMYKIAVRCREELHKINPRLLLCVYVLEIGNWFCRGLARGLGTPEVPVIDYAEATYFIGWGERAQKDMANFTDMGAYVAYGGTLWYGGYPPAEPNALPAQMYNFAMQAAGYWIWPGNDLHRNWSRVPVHRGVPAWLPDYWLAMVLANREIGRKMKDPSGYESPLATIKPGLVWSSRATPEQGFEWKSVPFMPVHVSEPARLYFWAPSHRGQVVLRAVAPGQDNGARVRLLRADGAVVAEATGELDEPASLKASGDGKVWCIEVSHAGLPLRDVGIQVEGAPPYLCSGRDALLRPPRKEGELLGWWPLDEGAGNVAHDRSGRPALDATIVDAKWAEGAHGKCLEFDGQRSRLSIRHSWTVDGLREFTISAWVKLRSLPERGHGFTILGKGPEAPVQHVWLWIGYPPSYSIILEMGNEKYQYGTSFASGALQWELGRWYHVAVTYKWDGEKAVARIYRDGELIAENAKSEELHSGSYPLSIGAYNNSAAHVMDGFIDDVRLYSRALTEQEIASLAQR